MKGFEVQGAEGAVKVSGSFGFLPAWVPNYQVTIQTRSDLADFFSQAPMIAPVAGKANLELTWLGEAHKPPQLRGKAFIKSFEIDGRKIGTLDLDYTGDLKNIEITNGELTAGGTTLNLFGAMHLQHLFSFSVDVVAEKVSLYQVLDDLGVSKPWVELFANIHVYGNGRLLPRFSFEGTSTGSLRDFYVFGHDARRQGKVSQVLSVPLLNLNSQVKMSPESFDFIDAVLSTEDTRIRTDARLYFSSKDGLDIETSSTKFNFQTIENEIAGLDFLGDGSLWARIKGPYNKIKISGYANINNFRFENYRLGNVETKLSYIKDRLRLSSTHVRKGRSHLKGHFSLHFKKRGRLKRAPLILNTAFQIQRGVIDDLQNIIPAYTTSGVMDVIRSLFIRCNCGSCRV